MSFMPDALRIPWDRVYEKSGPGTTMLFPKSDNAWYSKDANGKETLVGGGNLPPLDIAVPAAAGFTSGSRLYRTGRTVTIYVNVTATAAAAGGAAFLNIPVGHFPAAVLYWFSADGATGNPALTYANSSGTIHHVFARAVNEQTLGYITYITKQDPA